MRINLQHPSDWNSMLLREFGSFLKGKGISRDSLSETGVSCIRYGELYTTHNQIVREIISFIPRESTEGLIPLQQGDILFAGSGETSEEIGKSAAFIFDHETYAGGDIVIFRPESQDSTYLGYYLGSEQIQKIKSRLGQGGTVIHIYSKQLETLKISLPPLPEQKKIADILSTVDEAIQNTKAQIEKTKELKRGLMQKLFSEGIGHTEFRGSKLGRIPKDWEVVKYDKIVKKLFVGIATSTTEYYDNEVTGTLLIRNTNIKNGYLDLSSVEHISKTFDDSNTKKRLRTGDVLSVRTGYPGISAVVPLELDGSQSFTTLVSRFDQSLVNPYFVCYQLNSEVGRSQIKNLQFGGQQQNLNVGSLRLLDLIVPPKEEQDRIVEVLKVVDNKKNNLDNELRLQKDKKKGLMQKLLTGEVRVKI